MTSRNRFLERVHYPKKELRITASSLVLCSAIILMGCGRDQTSQIVGETLTEEAYLGSIRVEVGRASDALSEWGKATRKSDSGDLPQMKMQSQELWTAIRKMNYLSPPDKFKAIHSDLLTAFQSLRPWMGQALLASQKGDKVGVRKANKGISVECVPRIREAKAALYVLDK